MRICLEIGDRQLTRALETLLHERGHQVLDPRRAGGTCDLHVIAEAPIANGAAAVPTLALRPAAYGQPDREPADRLAAVLREGGMATWDSPLDTRMLLRVLAAHEGAVDGTTNETDAAPSLAESRHAWIVIDPSSRRLLRWSVQARDLLQLPTEATPEGHLLSATPLPGSLQESLIDRSRGRMPLDSLGALHMCVWWTDGTGHRVTCLVEAPGDMSAPADRHMRTLAEIGRMAATLAHEIRNPVASLAGALDLIDEADDPDERREIVAMARARLNDMRRLLDDTLRMSRPLDQDAEPVELQELVRSAAATLATSAEFEAIELRIDAPAEPVLVLAHVGPLQQALVNLLQNAAQAQGCTGRVNVIVTVDGRTGVVRIQDEGPGIPPELREEIFTPFYTTKTSGTGLGLAFVRRVVEAAGGAISAEPVSTGATIRMQLPLA